MPYHWVESAMGLAPFVTVVGAQLGFGQTDEPEPEDDDSEDELSWPVKKN